MTWDKAPRETRPTELVGTWAFVGVGVLRLVDDRSWWVWSFVAVMTVLAVVATVRWIRADRTYRAWVAWDEAGGPDTPSQDRG